MVQQLGQIQLNLLGWIINNPKKRVIGDYIISYLHNIKGERMESILITNLTNKPFILNWCYMSNGELKNGVAHIEERELCHELRPCNQAEKEAIEASIKYHKEIGELQVGKITEKECAKKNEKLKEEEAKNARKKQKELDKQIKESASRATGGNAQDFKINTEKAKED